MFRPYCRFISVLLLKRDFELSLSHENQVSSIEAFNSTSRYLDDLVNMTNVYVKQMVNTIYPKALQLNKTNTSDTEPTVEFLNLSISNDKISIIYDKRDDGF